jgi:DNA-binding NtrC family response regulator
MRRSRRLDAAIVGGLAAVVAIGIELAFAPVLDTAALARWLPARAPSGGVVLLSEAAGVMGDDTALRRLVARLSAAGAAAIVLDVPANAPRAGAASEALLRQTLGQAGNVVLALDGRAELTARAVGHTLGERAGALTAIPMLTLAGDRRVPALGLAAVAVATNAEPRVEATIVTIGDRRARLDGAGRALVRATAPLAELDLADADDSDGLASLVSGKIVVLPGDPARVEAMRHQAELADALLTGSTVAVSPRALGWIAALALGVATAWLWLMRRWWIAVMVTLAFEVAVFGAAILGLGLGVLAPITAPLGALVLAALGAIGWGQVDTRRRLQGLEAELGAMREALARHESAVETLEEDLEAARAAVERSADAARSADALRAQLESARRQEEETRRRLDALARESQAIGASVAADEACARVGIVTRDPAMLALFRDLEKAARSSLPILIMGEPGTGKELFARAAHRLSTRAGEPFVAVNMAAIPPDLFESELFGHVRGSFTGAVADRRGWFEQAHRGTIFLDEVGELRADHQAKLLRVLQEKSFHRVGAVRPTSVDVRVVAATNRDLERAVADGSFREDLYFRLKGLVLQLPPLRERRADVPVLAERLLQEAAAETKRPGLALSEAALAALERHNWPGNVRELQNCLRQAAALAERDVLAPADLRLTATAGSAEPRDTDAAVLAALRRHRFDMQATARSLGWDRSTVTQRLKGLGFRALVDARGDAARAAAELAGDPTLGRAVELKLREYHEHLLRTIDGFESADAAVAACRRRFKNLPERHFRSLETLLQLHFSRRNG